MVDRQASERPKQEAFDRAAADPEPISGSASGTPRPDTPQGTHDLAGVDPDFGLDPRTAAPGYGGTDRGRTEMGDYREPRALGREGGRALTGGAATDTGGQARGGDTTAEADSYSNLPQGLGEASTGANMPQRMDAPAATDNPPPAGVRAPAPGPSDAMTREEGLQSTRSPRE